MTVNSDKLHFRPAGRMVKILGEHLIRDNIVGVMELIKNGYDADASVVEVILNNLSDPKETEIIIKDDGIGMNETIIKGPWSEPAHGGKQDTKDNQVITKKGRLPLGEKGVGRFAAQKLGRYLELTTRPEKEEIEYHVSVDWNDFDKANTYLDEVALNLVKRTPQIFTGDQHGTTLRIREATTPWKKRDVEKLQAALIKLLSPTTEVNDFRVNFICEDYPDFQNLDRGDILDRFQFKIDCLIDDEGSAKYTYIHRSSDGKNDVNEVTESFNLWSRASDNWQRQEPTCGPMHIVILAWLRKTDNLKAYQITKAQLDELCGMGIYRDGFRVLPYGDSGDDWLGLDLRRTNQPGEKYGNNQIIGMVEISQKYNRALVDKTNREGLQENTAYTDMRDLVLATLSVLETESLEERSNETKRPESTRTLKKQIEILQEKVEKLENTPVKEEVEPKVNQEDKEIGILDGQSENSGVEDKIVEIPISELKEIREHVEKVDVAIDDAVKELINIGEERREAFLHLMGIGLAAERFTHEFDRLVIEIDSYLKQLESRYPFEAAVGSLRRRVEVLKNEIAVISAARYVRRMEQNTQTDVKLAIELSMKAHDDLLKKNNIQVELEELNTFNANISLASLSQVFDNIIVNAIYWLGVRSEVDDRKLSVVVDTESKQIIFSDNGSLIPPNIKKVVFKLPFVTSKPNGRGLGLYICNEILKRNKGSIEFLSENDHRNKYRATSFVVEF